MLRSPRLALRTTTVADAEHLFREYTADVDVVRYLTWRPHASVDDTRAFLAAAAQRHATGDAYTWVLELHEEPAPCGALNARPGPHGIEIGYVLSPRLWGRGLMAEAVELLADAALRDPSTYRVWAYCDLDNGASMRVLEKAGFDREGTLRRWANHPNVSQEPRDAAVYSRVR